MKKVLLATTVLVASAGFAAAEVKVTGGAKFGIKHDSQAADKNTVFNELDFNVEGSGETDSGISFGASFDLDTDHVDSVNAKSAQNDAEAWIETNGLKLTVGDIGEADGFTGAGDLGLAGNGFEAWGELGELGGHDVRIDYSINDIKVAASVDSADKDDWALGVAGKFAGFDAALGYNQENVTAGKNKVASLQVGYTAGAFGVKARFHSLDAAAGSASDAKAISLEATYKTGDLTLGLMAAQRDLKSGNDTTAVGVEASYDLGGGLKVAGGVGNIKTKTKKSQTVADFGVQMSF